MTGHIQKGKLGCHDCEFGQRENLGLFAEGCPVEDIPIRCMCPNWKNGQHLCGWDSFRGPKA